MRTLQRNIGGYTLIEFTVSAALLSIILLGAYGVLSTGNIIFVKDSARLQIQQQTRNAADMIVRDARPASSQTLTDNYNGTTNDHIVIFSPLTPLGVQYYLSGTNLVRSYNGSNRNIASNITSLQFSLNASLLTIQVTASKTAYGQAITFPLVQNVRLRNE